MKETSGVILYEVTLQVDPALASAVEDHMRKEHIPAIFATGCFRRIHFDAASATRFRTRYEAASRADLDRYLQDHASAFRAEFEVHFPVGVRITRETWTEREGWG
jgi:hypothetical protein